MANVYKNSTELMQLSGTPVYMNDLAEACLRGRLNLFLQGDTGSGKTQLAQDMRAYFPDKSLFILGRNDMDTRELFQRINLEKYRTAGSTEELRELTDKINYNLIVVDELSNCVPAVRAQLFNLFDGFVEINGITYPIGKDYSIGIATGNIGQKFTESSNELGRALKDRMHVIIDTDYFAPKASDTLEILSSNTNPRVDFNEKTNNKRDIIKEHENLVSREIPLEKLILANYLIHGLDYCTKGSKRKMKDAWPTQLELHEQGSDVGLILPVSVRAAKSIIRLSQSLDDIVTEKNPEVELNQFDSMMQAFKFVSAYSGILNSSDVQANYGNDSYKALDAVISTTNAQYKEKQELISAGFEMAFNGEVKSKLLNQFTGRWGFIKDILNSIVSSNK